MLNRERFEQLMNVEAFRGLAMAYELFIKFCNDNEEQLTDDYLDYMNAPLGGEEKKLSFPLYCFTVMFKMIAEIEDEVNE